MRRTGVGEYFGRVINSFRGQPIFRQLPNQLEDWSLNESHQVRIFLLLLVAFPGCKKQTSSPARTAASPPAKESATPGVKQAHPNQVSVTMGQTSPAAAKLNPRIAEAYSPEKVLLIKTTQASSFYLDVPENKPEAPPSGMKWVIVTVAMDSVESEVSIALSNIRLVDRLHKSYRLISPGGSETETFTDLREMNKYKMIEPPKLIMKSPTASTQSFLFAVAAKAEGLALEF